MIKEDKTPTPRRVLGVAGEDAACVYLERIGYRITGRNIRKGRLEIDIIAEDENTVVFVEVKTAREGSRFGRPSNAVDFRKRENLRAAARAYFREDMGSSAGGRTLRIDVIEVTAAPDGGMKLHHIKNAVTGSE